MNTCPCGSNKDFGSCCQPLINKEQQAQTPEQLMRSRYSAFATEHYQYILDTYLGKDKQDANKEALAEDYDGIQWLKLTVESTEMDAANSNHGFVTFSAYFGMKGKLFVLQERSAFEKMDGSWFYLADVSESSNTRLKLSRNDICFCGSEKKFKKCCEHRLN
ncbi:YchJ family protein [Alteromonas sp. a30]|uniref:YchJ family protein n=1 Tax=Alteromonas sp. a30 TaxID=2730917 RepID=UPI002282C48B|nr:YchJ family protein [Alteromonas sp. a30]MCY7294140.1 YchJ family protein [Alteromonas sp. a30]